jgi:hypothetical protein
MRLAPNSVLFLMRMSSLRRKKGRGIYSPSRDLAIAAGNSVVDLDSRRATRSTVPRCEVQVVMITPGYALAPLTGTPGPAYARENLGLSSDQMCG